MQTHCKPIANPLGFCIHWGCGGTHWGCGSTFNILFSACRETTQNTRLTSRNRTNESICRLPGIRFRKAPHQPSTTSHPPTRLPSLPSVAIRLRTTAGFRSRPPLPAVSVASQVAPLTPVQIPFVEIPAILSRPRAAFVRFVSFCSDPDSPSLRSEPHGSAHFRTGNLTAKSSKGQ